MGTCEVKHDNHDYSNNLQQNSDVALLQSADIADQLTDSPVFAMKNKHKVNMDADNSNEFFKCLLQQFHVVSRAYLTFKEHVEISGSLVVEIDNKTKERYVLSELVHCSGQVLSDSYCSKSCKILPGLAATSKSSNLLKDKKESHNRLTKSSSLRVPRGPKKRKHVIGPLPKKRKLPSDKLSQVTKNNSLDYHDIPISASSKVLKVNKKLNDSKPEDTGSLTSCTPIQQKPDDMGTLTLNIQIQPNSEDTVSHASFIPIQPKPENMDSQTSCITIQPMPENVDSQTSCIPIQPKPENVDSQTSCIPIQPKLENVDSQISCIPIQPKLENVDSQTSCIPIQPEPSAVNNNTMELDESGLEKVAEVIDLTLFDDDPDFAIVIKSEDEEDDSKQLSSSAEQQQYIGTSPVQASPDSTVIDDQSHFEVAYAPSSIAGKRGQYSKLSAKNVVSAVNRFRSFINDRFNAEVNILHTSPEILNEMLLMYFTESRKTNGQEYSGLTMKTLLSNIDVFLRSSGYLYSVAKGPHFQSTRDYIKSKI